jgi:molecular chaperone HtpG
MERKMAETGTISVSAENIFPIIKKALYSEHDIFLRELVSNAADAITKHNRLVLIGDSTHKDIVPEIRIIADEAAKTLTIKDNGLGMSGAEVKKYINEVAFSSANDFAKLFTDKNDQNRIIGHFGLGFYSAFMVASQVEIRTKSYRPEEKAVKWFCDGSIEFTLEEIEKQDIGTEIVLHIDKDSKEFLNTYTLKETVKKYCRFFPYKIFVGEEQVNVDNPIFARTASDVKDEEYKAFYKDLYPFEKEPLFWIHLNFDVPVPIRGVLFFPQKTRFEANQNKIKLYSNRVFVTDEMQSFIPEFLTLLQGVIDWPDMPLNVSRSALQGHPELKKIGAQIVKKVADKLNGMHKNDKENYEKIWADLHPFIKYGCMNDDKFAERMDQHVLFKSTKEGKFTTISEYLERNYPAVEEKKEEPKAEGEENKKTDLDKEEAMPEPKKIYYASDLDAQSTYIDMFKANGKEVLIMDSSIDAHFMQWMEYKGMKVTFVRIDSEVFDHVVSEKKDEKSDVDRNEKIVSIFKEVLNNDKITIEVKALKGGDIAGMVILPEFMRRMNEMQMNQNQGEVKVLDHYTFVVNAESPVVQKVTELKEAGRTEDLDLVVNHIHDLALITQRNFDPSRMASFVSRSNKILSILTK